VSLVTGIGTTIVPEEAVEVLSVYAGEELEVIGTGMTVVPDEPVTVLGVYAWLELSLTATGTTVELSEATTGLDEEATTAVMDNETLIADVATIELSPEATLEVELSAADAVPETDALSAVGVALSAVNNCDASEDAALDKTLENSEARDVDTAESVAVAAMLESSELREEARLDSTLVALCVTVGGTLLAVIAMLETSESTDDWADETALDASDAAEDTTLETLSELDCDADTLALAAGVAADVVMTPERLVLSDTEPSAAAEVVAAVLVGDSPAAVSDGRDTDGTSLD